MRQNSLLTNFRFCIIITQEKQIRYKKSAYAEATYAQVKCLYIKLSVYAMCVYIICFEIPRHIGDNGFSTI